MKKNAIGFLAALLIVALLSTSCSKEQSQSVPSSSSTAGNNLKSDKGSASARQVFYDGGQVVVNMTELSEKASEQLIANNSSINKIYASNDLDEEQDFLSVIDAIPTDGFNPLWQQFLIVFNDGFTPHQFTSDEDVEDAASGANPEITLENTGEIYRCAVIGVHPN